MTFNQYNGFNQLIKTTVGDKTIDYMYNGYGLRTSKTVNDVTTIHIWDGGQIVLELDGAGAVTNKYVRGINLLYAEDGAGTNRKWYLFNGHGDVVQLTGTDGNVTKTYDYDAFGNEKDPDPNDNNVFRYCGEYFDKETGTIYLRARYYNPVTGRFITEDSYWGETGDPLSLNLYTYGGNNPILFEDPDGHYYIVKDGGSYRLVAQSKLGAFTKSVLGFCGIYGKAISALSDNLGKVVGGNSMSSKGSAAMNDIMIEIGVGGYLKGFKYVGSLYEAYDIGKSSLDAISGMKIAVFDNISFKMLDAAGVSLESSSMATLNGYMERSYFQIGKNYSYFFEKTIFGKTLFDIQYDIFKSKDPAITAETYGNKYALIMANRLGISFERAQILYGNNFASYLENEASDKFNNFINFLKNDVYSQQPVTIGPQK